MNDIQHSRKNNQCAISNSVLKFPYVCHKLRKVRTPTNINEFLLEPRWPYILCGLFKVYTRFK